MIVRALGGEPATGKSTVMRRAMEIVRERTRSPWESFSDGIVRGHVNHEAAMVVLGTYLSGETFPGTDRLSMAVQPAALRVLRTSPWMWPYTVLFEGDRLFNLSFLLQLVELGRVEATVLVASNLSLEMRHSARGDRQGEGFLKGRKTKLDKIRAGFPCAIEINESQADVQRIAAMLAREA